MLLTLAACFIAAAPIHIPQQDTIFPPFAAEVTERRRVKRVKPGRRKGQRNAR